MRYLFQILLLFCVIMVLRALPAKDYDDKFSPNDIKRGHDPQKNLFCPWFKRKKHGKPLNQRRCANRSICIAPGPIIG